MRWQYWHRLVALSFLGWVSCTPAYGLTGKLVLDPVMVALTADIAPLSTYGTVFCLLNFAGML